MDEHQRRIRRRAYQICEAESARDEAPLGHWRRPERRWSVRAAGEKGKRGQRQHPNDKLKRTE